MRRISRERSRVLCIAALLGALLLAQPSIALAHGSGPVLPDTWWRIWSWDPLTLLLLVMAWLMYDLGVRTLWERAGRGHGIQSWRSLAFKGGLAVIAIALISPLDALSSVLFSAHMVQHLLLLFVAAPLFALSTAPLAFLWALPATWRRGFGHQWHRHAWLHRCWTVLAHPLTVWTLYALSLWLWHWPVLYQAALKNDLIHALEHFSFLTTSALFWWQLLKPSRHQGRDYGLGLVFIVTTALHSSILGALLVFSGQPWYPAYASGVMLWGFTPLGDQQVAGLIMWLPIGIVYLGATATLLALWLSAVERDMQRRERNIPQLRIENTVIKTKV